MAVALGLLPTGAVAAQSRLFAGTFGTATSTPVNPYPLESAESVAVDDSTHDIYVSDPKNARVEKFDSAGHFILMFGKAVNKTKVKAAAPEAEQNVCTAASGDECQAGDRTFGKTPLEEPYFLAVDNSSDASQGDVYVATGENTAGLIDKFNSSGQPIASWASAGQFDGSTAISPPAPIAGPFERIRGIAVNSSGNLWVSNQGAQGSANSGLFEFRQDASFVTDLRAQVEGSAQFAVDSENNVYFETAGEITKQNVGAVGATKAEEEEEGGYVPSYGALAVDTSNNELYVERRRARSAKGEGEVIQRYDSSCHPVITDEVPHPGCVFAESFGAGILHEGINGLAIDPSTAAHTLYVAEGTEVASFSVETVPDVVTSKPVNPTQSSATLTGTANPDGVELNAGLAGCRFEWGETAGFYEHTVACEQSAAQIGAGDAPVEVQAAVAGLQAGHTYHYRLVAGNANDVNNSIDEPSVGADLAFGPPLLENESAANVAAASATLQAAIDPNNIDTSFYIEYGTEAGAYGHLTPEIDVGSAGTSQTVTAHIQGLASSTVYHYRVVASNLLGTTTSEDHTFTTQIPGVFALPDERAWELVSPPNKHGALLQTLAGGQDVQASAEGNAFTYLASAPTESLPPGNANYIQVLSTRGEAGAVSWGSRDINTSREIANGFNEAGDEEYRFFSTDLASGVVEPFGAFDPSQSAEASERTAFLHTNYVGGNPADPCISSCYRPLVTGEPGFANVPEGIEFGGHECLGEGPCVPHFLGASPDGSHIVLESKVAGLVEGAPAESLYEWAGGQLQLVSVLPGGEPTPTGSNPGLGSAEVVTATGSVIAGSVSTDGSRIVWSAKLAGKEHLYLRDTAREETVELGTKEAIFESASADGSRVIFSAGGDLYVFEAPLGGALSAGHIADLIPGTGLVDTVMATSQDGSSIYFASKNVLTGTQSPQGEEAQAGQLNLYTYQAGLIRLIAVLSSEDEKGWTISHGLRNTMRVSPDGQWFAFMSERSLTGYDNRDASSGKPDEEVFLYEGSGNGGTGRLVCASCNPTGARPHGIFDANTHEVHRILDTQTAWNGNWLAASVPAWTTPLYQSRYLSDSGRLFFNSSDALVPSDVNGTEDVYEYEPPGMGNCITENTTFSSRSDGCVDLISSGTSSAESVFMDASENGDDVFFLTSAQLSSQDTDAAVDVYDARVGGGSPEPQSPPACEGDACQSPVAAPTDPTPGSLTYSGPGNPGPLLAPRKVTQKKTVRCAKGKKLTHGKCVKLKKKPKKAKKSAKARRAGNRRGAKS